MLFEEQKGCIVLFFRRKVRYYTEASLFIKFQATTVDCVFHSPIKLFKKRL